MLGTAFRAEKARTRPLLLGLFAFLLQFILLSAVFAGVQVTDLIGSVQARPASGQWVSVTRYFAVMPGTEVRTGRSSRAVLTFDDRSRVEIGPNSVYVLEDGGANRASMRFNLGAMRAWVNKTLSQRFTVRTPTAVASVRGTEFGVTVQQNGSTNIDLFKGILGVSDNKGGETELQAGQKIQVDSQGLGSVKSLGEDKGTSSGDKTREALKREVGLDMSKEEVQAAAAIEQKNAIYKEGKALVDVNGHRVRLEDYIIRASANSFKLVVLNERVDRFDYFYYTGNFNKPLPDDISVALRQIQGQAVTAPEYFLTSYETGRSNTVDNVKEVATGGHLVNVNNNGDSTDDVTSYFDPGTDSVVSITAATPYFKTIFDNYDLTFNGVSHHSWATNVGAYVPTLDGNGNPVYNPANTTGAQRDAHLNFTDVTSLVAPPNCATVEACTWSPTPGKFHDSIYLESGDGLTWEKFDNYIINDEGQVANVSDFSGITSGSAFKRLLLNWNYQQVITASEFNGRKIDLVFEPKVLIQSGLIP